MIHLKTIFVVGWPFTAILLVAVSAFISAIGIGLIDPRFRRPAMVFGAGGWFALIAMLFGLGFGYGGYGGRLFWLGAAGSYGALAILGGGGLLTNSLLQNRGSRWFHALASGTLAILLVVLGL